MANKKAAIKSLRQDKKKHERNKSKLSELRTLAKKANKLMDDQKKKEADEALKELESKLSKAAKKNVIKQNTASRRISRLRSKWAQIEA
ncbi:MAG: 30S ribosomal protein S20 [Candidatus Omnitrophica bacterium]|nr:30S ribosomal protein S20 [Candidatus Omnitrophota bacterium]